MSKRSVISLDDLTVNNIGVLKKINQVTLPTTYPEQWYKEALEAGDLVKLAYYSEIPVGAIKAKTLIPPNQTVPTAIYVESLAVLKSYQNLGIGAQLVKYMEEETKRRFIHEVKLHVWIENKSVIEWYKKLGFVEGEQVENYYKEQGLENPHAIVLSKSV